MVKLRSPKFIFVMIVVALVMVVMAIPMSAARGESGFRALNGKDAQDFRVPQDMRSVGNNSFKGIDNARYQQYVGDAAVFGGQISVLSNEKGMVAVIGAHYPEVVASNSVKLNAGQARAAAIEAVGRGGNWLVELNIDPASGRQFYIVENQKADSRWFHYVDAETGEIFNSYNGLAHGSGIGVTGDTKDLTGLTTQSGNTYELLSQDGRIRTNSANNRRNLPSLTAVATDSDDYWTDGALVDAHYYANVTDDYLQNVHGFNWLSHYSQGMVSSAHVQRDYVNAYWNGQQMAYGDGDGVNYLALSGDLDVVGHELSHGVTDATSDLIYQNESGALNESFSDIMGAAIEFYYGTGNWTVGEDFDLNGDGFRDMSDPNADGDPSHWDERYTGTGDNGGVHINSGISNHFFYLLVNGGQNANSTYASGTNVNGIGMQAAEQIVFVAYTGLNASATFCDARAATIAVAGGNSANVADAWDEVGITEALCGGGGTNPGGGDGPVISNVTAYGTGGPSFNIDWDTDVASDSTVIFTCCGTYNDATMTTSHSMDFRGSKNTLYEFYVSSTDANGNTTTEGPFQYQN